VHILLFFCLSFKKILEFLSRVLIIKKPWNYWKML
jgi:hypothetical protein